MAFNFQKVGLRAIRIQGMDLVYSAILDGFMVPGWGLFPVQSHFEKRVVNRLIRTTPTELVGIRGVPFFWEPAGNLEWFPQGDGEPFWLLVANEDPPKPPNVRVGEFVVPGIGRVVLVVFQSVKEFLELQRVAGK